MVVAVAVHLTEPGWNAEQKFAAKDFVGQFGQALKNVLAVVEAAGGIVTDWSGNPAHDGGRALAAATPELHAQALRLMAPFLS